MKCIILLALTIALSTASSVGPWSWYDIRTVPGYGNNQGVRYGMMTPQNLMTRQGVSRYPESSQWMCDEDCKNRLNDQRESRQWESNQVETRSDLRDSAKTRALMQLLDDMEGMFRQTGSDVDVKEIRDEAGRIAEKIIRLTQEIDRDLVQETLRQILQKTSQGTSGPKSERMQQLAQEKAVDILRKTVEEIQRGSQMGKQQSLEELMQGTLKTAITTQMVMKSMQVRQPAIRFLTSDFKNQVQSTLLKGSFLEFESALKQCKTQIRQIETQIQFLKKQLQFVRTCQALANQEDQEKLRSLEEIEQQICQQLDDLLADQLACGMVAMCLQKVMLTQEYFCQEMSLAQVDTERSMRMPMWNTMRY